MKKRKFDGLLDSFILYFLGFIRLDRYYKTHPTFRRFAKYGVLTTLTFWVAKAPLIWVFDIITPDLNLVLFTIPSYLISAFIVGVVLSVIGFVYSEWEIWKQ